MNRTTNLKFCTTLETEGEVVHVKLVKAPQFFITDRSKVVVFLRFSVACFWCHRKMSFGDVSPYVCSFLFLVRFRLLSGNLLGTCCSLG